MDYDLALHERVNGTVIFVGAGLLELDRDRLVRVDVLAPPLPVVTGDRVKGAALVAPGHGRPHLDAQLAGTEYELARRACLYRHHMLRMGDDGGSLGGVSGRYRTR